MALRGGNQLTAKKTDADQKDGFLTIPKLNVQTFNLRLVGDTPLITHAWDEKAKKMMLDKQMKKASSGRAVRVPELDFLHSLYWLTPKPAEPTLEDLNGAKFGFPSTAFKSAAVDAGYQSGVTTNKARSRCAFYVLSDMVEIIGMPTMREDMVKVGMGVADIRFRAEFKNWETYLKVQYNEMIMSPEQIVNLFNLGGFSVGVGEWRPAKDGNFGRFHVEL
jgi:hypothetical protein